MRKGSNFLQLHGTSVNLSAPFGLFPLHKYLPPTVYCCLQGFFPSLSHTSTGSSLLPPPNLISSLLSACCLELLCFQFHSHPGFKLSPEVPAGPVSHTSWEDRPDSKHGRPTPNCLTGSGKNWRRRGFMFQKCCFSCNVESGFKMSRTRTRDMARSC